MAEAARLLGRTYTFTGTVVSGDQRGRELGFPTANLAVPEHQIVPADGIYACLATVDGRAYRAAVSIGVRPTFGADLVRLVEAYLLDFSDDIYGKPLHLEFQRRLRGEEKFTTVDALLEQMQRDVASVREQVTLR